MKFFIRINHLLHGLSWPGQTGCGNNCGTGTNKAFSVHNQNVLKTVFWGMGLIKVFLQTYLFHFCLAYIKNRKILPANCLIKE